jgi:hypothetical protein
MSVHGRVTVLAIAPASCLAASGSRYSERNFMGRVRASMFTTAGHGNPFAARRNL